MDPRYASGYAWILAEQELEGVFKKWNNNAGAVRGPAGAAAAGAGAAGLGAIQEDDGEEEEEEEAGGGGSGGAQGGPASIRDVPQCFSHFSWSVTNGGTLVCDLQVGPRVVS